MKHIGPATAMVVCIMTLLIGAAARAQEERVGYTPEGAYDPDLVMPPVMGLSLMQALAADPIAGALDIDGAYLLSASIGASDANGTAILTSSAPGFPSKGDSYVVLSSGCANKALSPNTAPNFSCDLGGLHTSQGGDLVQLTLQLTVPKWAKSWALNWKMLSEEYPEYVGSRFNDTFLAEVGTTAFTIANNVVTAPNNVAHDSDGAPISVNTTGMLGMTPAAAAGTTYDGATAVLTTAAPIAPGTETLTIVFSVMDLGDHSYDTAVFLDNFSFSMNEVGKPITQPGDEVIVDIGGNGIGRITGNGIDCQRLAGVNTGTCSVSLAAGTAVSLSIDPAFAAFSDFVGWKVPYCSVNSCVSDDPEWIPPQFGYRLDDPYQFTMSRDAIVTPVFSGQTLTVKAYGLLTSYGEYGVAGASDGVDLLWSSGGTSCVLGVAACTAKSANGRTWVLNPPSGGNGSGQFLGWSGACTGNGTCTVTMDAAKTVTARFGPGTPPAPPQYELAVQVDGPAGMLVTGDKGFVAPSTAFPAYTVVTLTASAPPAGYYFDAWSGCTSVNNTVSPPTCKVSLTADAAVTATYKPYFGLTVTVKGIAAGAVDVKSGTTSLGICTSGTCTYEVKQGAAVSLWADSLEAASVKWGGVCEDATAIEFPSVCSMPMTHPWDVSATFNLGGTLQ